VSTSTDTDVIPRLMALVEDASGGDIRPERGDTGPGSLRRLGISSLTMLEFLVAIEDEFGIEWDDDVDQSVFDSFGSIATHIGEELGQ
jgi:acyl carrier protein